MIRRLTYLFVIVLAAGCSQPTDSDVTVLAEIGDRQITVAEFRAELARRSATLGGGFGTAEQQAALLQALVAHERLLATAEALELDHDPEIQSALERVLTSAVRRELESRSIKAVTVTDAEVAARYESHQADYTKAERRHAAIIHSVSAKAVDRDRLRSVREQARADGGKHFGQLAIDHSDDRSSRYRGGVIGWLSDDRRERYKWPEAVVDAVFELSMEGDITDVIETDKGLYLVRLSAIQPGGAKPLAELANGIRASIRREKVLLARDKALDELSNGLRVIVHDERLKLIEPIEQSNADRQPPALPGRSET